MWRSNKNIHFPLLRSTSFKAPNDSHDISLGDFLDERLTCAYFGINRQVQERRRRVHNRGPLIGPFQRRHTESSARRRPSADNCRVISRGNATRESLGTVDIFCCVERAFVCRKPTISELGTFSDRHRPSVDRQLSILAMINSQIPIVLV